MRNFDRLVRVRDHREMGFCLMFGDSFHTANHSLVCYALQGGNFIITSFSREIAVLLPGMRKWRMKETHPNNRFINAHLWAVESAIHYAGIYPISVRRWKW
jgi:hypothetical protein